MQSICIVGKTAKAEAQPYPPEQLAAEVAYVRNSYAEGVVRQIWSRADVGGAVLLLETPSIEDATAIVSQLPLLLSGFLQIDKIVPLAPYRAFGAPS